MTSLLASMSQTGEVRLVKFDSVRFVATTRLHFQVEEDRIKVEW